MAKEGQHLLAHFCFSSVGRRFPAVYFEPQFVVGLLGDHTSSEEIVIVVVKPDLLRDEELLLCHGHCISISHCRPPPLCGSFSCFCSIDTLLHYYIDCCSCSSYPYSSSIRARNSLKSSSFSMLFSSAGVRARDSFSCVNSFITPIAKPRIVPTLDAAWEASIFRFCSSGSSESSSSVSRPIAETTRRPVPTAPPRPRWLSTCAADFLSAVWRVLPQLP